MTKRLLGIFSYQGIPLAISLVQVPLLLSIIGLAGYGQIQFLTMVSMIFLMIMDFGSNDFFFKKIGEARSSPDQDVNEVIERLIVTRCVTASAGFLLSLGLVLVTDPEIVLFCFSALLLSVTPTWIFFVIDRFHVLNIFQMIWRSLNLGALYFLLTAENFLIVFPTTLCVALIAINIMSYWYLLRHTELRPKFRSINLMPDFKEMGQVFLGKLCLRIYWFVPYWILKGYDLEALGAYSLLDRIGQVLRTIPDGFSGHLMQDNKRNGSLKRIVIVTILVGLVLFWGYSASAWAAISFLSQDISLAEIGLYAGGCAIYAASSILANRYLVMNSQYLVHLMILATGIAAVSFAAFATQGFGIELLERILLCVLAVEMIMYVLRLAFIYRKSSSIEIRAA